MMKDQANEQRLIGILSEEGIVAILEELASHHIDCAVSGDFETDSDRRAEAIIGTMLETTAKSIITVEKLMKS